MSLPTKRIKISHTSALSMNSGALRILAGLIRHDKPTCAGTPVLTSLRTHSSSELCSESLATKKKI